MYNINPTLLHGNAHIALVSPERRAAQALRMGMVLLAQDIILVLLKDSLKADEPERAELWTLLNTDNGCVTSWANALGISVERLSAGIRRRLAAIVTQQHL